MVTPKWIMHSKKESIFLTLPKCIRFRDARKPTEAPKKSLELGSKKQAKREEIVLASKIAGPNPGLAYIRENMDFSPTSIALSIDKSLTRLQTDYIDLYQLHWPERKTNFFGQRGFKVQNDAWEDNIQNVLETLEGFIKQGKIKHIGLSNETPWGIMRFLEESK